MPENEELIGTSQEHRNAHSTTLYDEQKNELLQQMHTNLTLEELTNLVNIAKGSKKNWK